MEISLIYINEHTGHKQSTLITQNTLKRKRYLFGEKEATASIKGYIHK